MFEIKNLILINLILSKIALSTITLSSSYKIIKKSDVSNTFKSINLKETFANTIQTNKFTFLSFCNQNSACGSFVMNTTHFTWYNYDPSILNHVTHDPISTLYIKASLQGVDASIGTTMAVTTVEPTTEIIVYGSPTSFQIPEFQTFLGSWGDQIYCRKDAFIVGLSVKVHTYVPAEDYSGLNAIRFICDGSKRTILATLEGPDGTWSTEIYCPAGQVVRGIRYKVQSGQGGLDDSSVNGINLICSDGTVLAPELEGGFGAWFAYKMCSSINEGMCSIKCQVDLNQGSGDDTGLNNCYTYCCLRA